jgi:hypothetical protein
VAAEKRQLLSVCSYAHPSAGANGPEPATAGPLIPPFGRFDKGWGGTCDVPASNGIMLRVSATEIAIHADTFSTGVSSQTLLPIGVHKLTAAKRCCRIASRPSPPPDAG